jgi:hypothetical protein
LLPDSWQWSPAPAHKSPRPPHRWHHPLVRPRRPHSTHRAPTGIAIDRPSRRSHQHTSADRTDQHIILEFTRHLLTSLRMWSDQMRKGPHRAAPLTSRMSAHGPAAICGTAGPDSPDISSDRSTPVRTAKPVAARPSRHAALTSAVLTPRGPMAIVTVCRAGVVTRGGSFYDKGAKRFRRRCRG